MTIKDKPEALIKGGSKRDALKGRRRPANTGTTNADPMDETAYLLSSPVNAARLVQAIAQLDAGHVTERALIEP